MTNLLVEKHLDSIIKIKAFDNNNRGIKIFTGSFYIPRDVTNNYNYANNFSYNNEIFIVTAKHAIKDDKIAKLKISFYFNQKFQSDTIDLNEYVCIDIPECDDLTVIHVKKKIYHNFSSRILKSTIFLPSKFSGLSPLNYWVCIPGYYNENVNSCILEFATICSRYNSDKFYIKSKNIVEGYSGAPVFIEIPTNFNNKESSILFLIGYVSKNVGNDNIEIVSAENLLLIDEILKRKYLS
mgnify:FL=1